MQTYCGRFACQMCKGTEGLPAPRTILARCYCSGVDSSGIRFGADFPRILVAIGVGLDTLN
eukprot:4493679-Amphidinium_carterae.1